jgi:hypothetical protein
MVKNEFQIYILVRHELAHSPACFFLFSICIKKYFFATHWYIGRDQSLDADIYICISVVKRNDIAVK